MESILSTSINSRAELAAHLANNDVIIITGSSIEIHTTIDLIGLSINAVTNAVKYEPYVKAEIVRLAELD